MNYKIAALCVLMALEPSMELMSQPISGIWHGKVGGQTGISRTWQVELKIIREEDSLRGIAYYQISRGRYIQMPVKGYFNPYDGTVTWWHSSLQGTDERGDRVSDPLPVGMKYEMDFNCPDGIRQQLDGQVYMSTWSGRTWEIPVKLEKTEKPDIEDAWNDLVKISPPARIDPDPPVADKVVILPKTPQPKVNKVNETPQNGTMQESKKVDAGGAKTPPQAIEKPPAQNSLALQQSARNPTVSTVNKPADSVKSPPSETAIARQVTEKAINLPSPPKQQEKETTIAPKAELAKQDIPKAPEPAVKQPAKAKNTTPTAFLHRQESPTPTVTQPVAKPQNMADNRIAQAPVSKEQTGMTAAVEEKQNKEAEIPQKTKQTSPETLPEVVSPSPMDALYRSREKKLVQEVAIAGDTLFLDFYDHAEVDGDSISIYLDDRLIQSHILLKSTPHTIAIPTSQIKGKAELTMVAENLGRIPPNTSLMIFYISGERHEASLESSERTSAMVRFYWPEKKN